METQNSNDLLRWILFIALIVIGLYLLYRPLFGG